MILKTLPFFSDTLQTGEIQPLAGFWRLFSLTKCMRIDPRAIQIYTDGSCYGNPGGASGCAAIVVYPDHLNRPDAQIVDISCAESKIPRMELLACVRALEWIPRNTPWPDVTRVQIITDSLYVTESVNRARNWQRNKWRNSYGEPMENVDLWKKLLTVFSRTGMATSIEWTAGKKSPSLKKIDAAAKAAAKRVRYLTPLQKKLSDNIDSGYRRGSVVRSMVLGSATKYPAAGQIAAVRPYRKKMMNKHEIKVRFDVFERGTQTYTQSFYAYTSLETATDIHNHHGYVVKFNQNSNYPTIIEVIEEISLPVLNMPVANGHLVRA